MKCVLASKQDIIDYRNELVKTGWTPREWDAEQLVDALMTGKKINIPQWLRDKLKEQL